MQSVCKFLRTRINRVTLPANDGIAGLSSISGVLKSVPVIFVSIPDDELFFSLV
jgi:hypothetical protein